MKQQTDDIPEVIQFLVQITGEMHGAKSKLWAHKEAGNWLNLNGQTFKIQRSLGFHVTLFCPVALPFR